MDSLRENHKELKNKQLRLQSQQRFRSKKYSVLTEEADKIGLRVNNDKRIQSFDSIETYTCIWNKQRPGM